MVLLNEDTRNQLIQKSKHAKKERDGKNRYEKRLKSRIVSSVREYNSMDMNKLFRDDILTVNVPVKGETDNYLVKISFGGFCKILRDRIEQNGGKLELRDVVQALTIGFNKNDVYVFCTCPDNFYRHSFHQTQDKISSGEPQNIPAPITNPRNDLGIGCKHIMLVLSNAKFLVKTASVIFNYINYMEKHYEKLYADVIYPAIYGKKYEKDVQLPMDDEEPTSPDLINKANLAAVQRGRFQKGNTQGIRFAKADEEEAEQGEMDI